MWFGRFVGVPWTYPVFGADRFADFDTLQRERALTDRSLLEWTGNVSAEWLASTLEYRRAPPLCTCSTTTTTTGGQLTTLLKQAGVDPGVTDLPWLPGVVEIAG